MWGLNDVRLVLAKCGGARVANGGLVLNVELGLNVGLG